MNEWIDDLNLKGKIFSRKGSRRVTGPAMLSPKKSLSVKKPRLENDKNRTNAMTDNSAQAYLPIPLWVDF